MERIYRIYVLNSARDKRIYTLVIYRNCIISDHIKYNLFDVA